ncbi:MAG: nicotinate-nicotinamide nucleotide adenylyltransferase [Armatimonadetes bacterium]|nr:nicotinate-nicotinamide nucleotide adenylyltransferase [Armatimonadota bacterium]
MGVMDLQPILAELINSLKPKLGFLKRAEFGISQSGQKLGVFSGSFNPPTVAHVKLCQKAQKHLGLDEILLLLAIVNLDKTQFDFSLEERLEMMLAVAQEQPNWSVALCSHGRFVEKAQAVKDAYPDDTKVWFIVGYDTLVRIFERRFYLDRPMEEALVQFFELAHIAVFPRGEADETRICAFLRQAEVQPFAQKIDVLPTEPSLLFVSSTFVREKLKRGEDVTELVPKSVLKFLRSPNWRKNERR